MKTNNSKIETRKDRNIRLIEFIVKQLNDSVSTYFILQNVVKEFGVSLKFANKTLRIAKKQIGLIAANSELNFLYTKQMQLESIQAQLQDYIREKYVKVLIVNDEPIEVEMDKTQRYNAIIKNISEQAKIAQRITELETQTQSNNDANTSINLTISGSRSKNLKELENEIEGLFDDKEN